MSLLLKWPLHRVAIPNSIPIHSNISKPSKASIPYQFCAKNVNVKVTFLILSMWNVSSWLKSIESSPQGKGCSVLRCQPGTLNAFITGGKVLSVNWGEGEEGYNIHVNVPLWRERKVVPVCPAWAQQPQTSLQSYRHAAGPRVPQSLSSATTPWELLLHCLLRDLSLSLL